MLKKYVFYYCEHIGGNKYKENIYAENFRIARNIFFEKYQHIPYRIDAVHEFCNDVLIKIYK